MIMSENVNPGLHYVKDIIVGCEFVKRWRNAAGVDEQLIAEKTGHRSSCSSV